MPLQPKAGATVSGEGENVELGGLQSCPVLSAPTPSGASLRYTASPLSLLTSLSTDTRSMLPYEQRQDWPLGPGPRQEHSAIPAEPISRSKAPAAGNLASEPGSAAGDDDGFITGFPLVCLMVGLMLAVFLISLDRTIISTAIPYITHLFQSTPDIGWYGSAYMVTACAFQPLFGKIFTMFSVKISYLVALFIFEIGSLLCAVAGDSRTLIVGRAIAGFGSAGITSGSFVVVAAAVPLQARPILMAVVGLMFGVGATIGPLLGGVFTDFVTWRWCFYINLPVGGATMAAMILFFNPRKKANARRGFFERLMDLDFVGNVLIIGACIMLFIAFQVTTQGIAWSSTEVIGLLVGSGVLGILFTLWQWWKGDGALIPPRIITQRTVAASCGQAFTMYGALVNLTFFLPIWFQAIRGESAMQSGVDMIPFFLVNALFSVGAGIFVSKVGYATPPAVVGSAIGTVGLGLMTLLRVDTTTAQWVGYQALTSAGFGMSIQQGFTAVQTVLSEDEAAIGTSAVVAAQSLGAAVFVSIGNIVFQHQLLRATASHVLSDMDIKKLIDGGAAAFRQLVPADMLPQVLEIYNEALIEVFTMSLPLGALAAIISCFIEWKSVKEEGENQTEEKNHPSAGTKTSRV
ncbi:Major facilitator superfamily domain-containing protein [Madurella fahalii]|uniref:Major facilitator superfamily domain-containing protein n=1 Tax=Madurella fahalii TaxID=1157608 RepID=A0ABQ0FZR6_9PEZI